MTDIYEDIDAFGYARLAAYIMSAWTEIELRHTDGTPAMPRITESDGRMTIENRAEDGYIEYNIQITGEDADIVLPMTFTEIAIFDTNSNGTPVKVKTVEEKGVADSTRCVVLRFRIAVPIPTAEE